jgi:kynurenine formamidase
MWESEKWLFHSEKNVKLIGIDALAMQMFHEYNVSHYIMESDSVVNNIL